MDNPDLLDIEVENAQLTEVLEVYDCRELLPLVNRIMWLDSIREVLGYIPPAFDLDHEELRLLVVLREEVNKKMKHESLQLKRKTQTSHKSTPTDLSRYVTR